jgi:RNA polymerase sigma factor (sigma-70 family)
MNDSLDLDEITRQFTKYQTLTSDQQHDLFKIVKESDDKQKVKNAKHKLILHNYKLVLSVAKKYTSDRNKLVNYFQDGLIGLNMAVDKFDNTLNVKFSTYAYYWITNQILLSKENDNLIKIPNHAKQKINKIKKLKAENNIINIDELLDKSGMSRIMWEDIQNNQLALSSLSSLDATIVNKDSSGNLHEVISYESDYSPFDFVIKHELNDKIMILLNKLPKQYKFIIQSHYGINCNQLTLLEISCNVNIAEKTIKNIITKCHKRIANMIINNDMKDIVIDYVP